jgi:hypothetical protein
MRRSVKSHSEPVPVDAHERTRDYVTEEEFLGLVEATRQSRHHWRDAAMLMLTFYRKAAMGVVDKDAHLLFSVNMSRARCY